MPRITLLSLCLLLSVSTFAQEEIRIETKTTKAKIFLKGANLTRTSEYTIPAGKSTIILEKLPMDLDFSTVKLNMGPEVEIHNISQAVNYNQQFDASEATLTLIKKRDSLEKLIQYEKLNESLAKEKLALIKQNSLLSDKEDGSVDMEVINYLKLYDKQMREIKTELMETEFRIEEWQEQMADVEEEITSLRNVKKEPSLEIKVEVKASVAMNGPLELEYYTRNASWFPQYSARVGSASRKLDLGLKALIVQTTPEQWDSVKVTLSNVQPDKNTSMPELEKWELTYERLTRVRPAYGSVDVSKVSGVVSDEDGEPLIGVNVIVEGTTIGTVTDLDGSYEISIPNNNAVLQYSYVGFNSHSEKVKGSRMNVKLDAEIMTLDEVVVVGYARSSKSLAGKVAGVNIKGEEPAKFATISEKFNAVEYEIIERQTLSNDGTSKLIDVQEYALDAVFEHHAVPKLKPDVFIQAVIPDWDEYYFLNGEMNIYFENSYVGKSLLQANVFSDTLFLSLGKDHNVSVERKPLKTTSRKQFIGPSKVVTKSFQIQVKNLKTIPINLFLHDQIPVSIINTVDVDLLEKGGAQFDEVTGELLWKNTLVAKGNSEYEFSYRVKHPKYEEVILE